MPGVLAIADKAAREGIPVRGAEVFMDFLTDEVQLVVKHGLVSRGDIEIDARDWRNEIGSRLQAAMRLFHRMPAAKALCVDRRRLNARGEKARKETNRPVRKPAKRRFA